MATRIRSLPDDAESRVTLAKFIAQDLPGTSVPSLGKTLTDKLMADPAAFIRTW
jgi:hypothetical protein